MLTLKTGKLKQNYRVKDNATPIYKGGLSKEAIEAQEKYRKESRRRGI